MRQLFVYGTLMRGQPNHSWLEAYAERWEPAVTDGRLHDLGEYPALVLREGHVQGELVHLISGQVTEALARLDRLEGFRPGVPETSLFLRSVIPVTTEEGASLEAFAYVYNVVNQRLPPIEDFPIIASGRWF